MLDEAEITAMMLLPILLPETHGSTLSCGKGKRKMWKPSIAETMSHFIDLQEVK